MFILEQIRKIIRHRELIIKFALRDIKGKYSDPIFGFLWAIFLPLCLISVFKFVFSVILKVQSGNFPYFIYIMTAVLPWNYLQGAISQATTSIVGSGNLLKKVNFPREIVPISIVFSNLMSFIINLIVLFFFLILYHVKISKFCWLLPAIVLIHTGMIIGISLITSSLYIRYRDTKYLVEVVLMILFYLIPSVYILDTILNISGDFFEVYMLNPLVGLLNLYRIALLDGYLHSLPAGVSPFNTIFLPSISAIIIFILGFWLFRLQEAQFADFV